MGVQVSDVRAFLDDLPESLVSDNVIQKHIDSATALVNAVKSSQASQEQVDQAILVQASYQTLLAYATSVERSMGTVPAPILRHLEYLRELAQTWLTIVRRSSPPKFVPVMGGIDDEQSE